MRIRALIAVAGLAALPVAADPWNECEHKAPRHLSTPSAGVTRVVVIGRAGSLNIQGQPGASEIRANGTACTNTRDLLSRITLVATRSGSEVRIEAKMPERESFDFDFTNNVMKLDFEVTLPAGADLVVEDGSGSLSVADVASADIEDGSGEVTVRGIRGDVTVEDGSGTLKISDVQGDVRIDDGSGEIEIDNVEGNVLIDDDGSGSVDIRNVRRNVTIEDKGSGSVDVDNISGDFTVLRKGSGSIDYDRVSGRVQIPERRGRRN